MKSVKMIVSDIDGTLLPRGANAISPEMIKLIRRMKGEGIYFAAASGRQYLSMQNLFSPVAGDILYICENGALTCYQEKRLDKCWIETPVGKELVEDMQERKEGNIVLSGELTSYLLKPSPGFPDHVRYFVGNHATIIERIEQIREPYMKISLHCERGIPEGAREFYPGKYGSRLQIADAGNNWYDFTAQDCNKGNAIRKAAALLGFSVDQIIAFGNASNDISMLEAAGLGVVVESGTEPAKAAADEVCGSVEEWIKQNIFK